MVTLLLVFAVVSASAQVSLAASTSASALATQTGAADLDSSVITLVNFVEVLGDASPKLASAESLIEQVEAAYPSGVSVEQAVVQGGPLNTEAIFLEHNYPSLESALQTVASAEQADSGLAAVQSSLEAYMERIPSLLTAVSQYVSDAWPTFAQATQELQEVAEKYPSALTLISYVEAVELTNPSIVSAEQVIQQIKDSSPLLLSYVNLVRSQPSALTDPTLFDSIESQYGSLFDALAELSAAFLEHSTFSTVQSTIERLDTSFPNLITAMQSIQDVISPSTQHMVSEMQSLEDSHSSLQDYIRQISQLDSVADQTSSNQPMKMSGSNAMGGMDMFSAPEPAQHSSLAAYESNTELQNVIESVQKSDPTFSSLLSSMVSFSHYVYNLAQNMPAKKCSSMQVDVEVFS